MRSFGFAVPRQTVAQKLPLPRPRHRTLGVIHLELEPLGQKRQSDFAAAPRRPVRSRRRCCSRPHSGRTHGPSFQFPVQIVRAGCSTAAAIAARLAACPAARLHQTVRHHARLPDSAASSVSIRASPDSTPLVPSARSWFTRSKNFSRSMSTTQRCPAHVLARPDATPDARCVPDESRSSAPRRSAPRSVVALDATPAGSDGPPPSGCPAFVPALRLGYVYPPHRLRFIVARQQSGPNRRPVSLQMVLQFGHLEVIYSRRAFVRLHPLIREFEVASLHCGFHQTRCRSPPPSSAFGSPCPPRRKRQPRADSVRPPARLPDLPDLLLPSSASLRFPSPTCGLSRSALRLLLTPTMASADFWRCVPALAKSVALGTPPDLPG